MIKAIAHVCIGSRNLAETEKFYCGALCLEKKFEFRKAGRLIGFYIAVGGNNFLEFFESAEMPVGKYPVRHICLEVDDIRKTHQSMKEKGVGVGEIKMGADNSWQFWCSDPDGVDIEFHQYTKDSSQLTGATCKVNW